MSSVYGISSHSKVISLWNCLCPKSRLFPNSTAYVPTAQFMFLEDSLFTQSRVYALTVHFISLKYYLCPLWIVYVPRVDFMFLEDSLCTQSRVYALTVQFMSQQYSLSRKSTVYVPRVQLMSQQCSLVPSVLCMSLEYRLCP